MNLKEIRKQRNLSQKAISDYLNCSQVVYSRYESGSREPPIDFLIKLADFYGITLDELVGRTKSKNESIIVISQAVNRKHLKFANTLKEEREKAGITQSKMAENLKTQVRTYGSWERGERQPDFDMLAKIADFFNVSIDYLLGHEVPKISNERGFVSKNRNYDFEQIIIDIVQREFQKKGL